MKQISQNVDSDEELSQDDARMAMEVMDKIHEARKRSWRRCCMGMIGCVALLALAAFFLGEKVAGSKIVERFINVEVDEVEEEFEMEHPDLAPKLLVKDRNLKGWNNPGQGPKFNIFEKRFRGMRSTNGFFYVGNGWCTNFAGMKLKENKVNWQADHALIATSATSLMSPAFSLSVTERKTTMNDDFFMPKCATQCRKFRYCIGYMTKEDQNGPAGCDIITTTDIWASGGIFMASKEDDNVHCWAKKLPKDLEKLEFKEMLTPAGESGVAGPASTNKLCASNGQSGDHPGTKQLCKDSTGDGRIFINDCDLTCIEYRCERDPYCIGYVSNHDFFRPVSAADKLIPNIKWHTFIKYGSIDEKSKLGSNLRELYRPPQVPAELPNRDQIPIASDEGERKPLELPKVVALSPPPVKEPVEVSREEVSEMPPIVKKPNMPSEELLKPVTRTEAPKPMFPETNDSVDCEQSEWKALDSCSKNCGGGVMTEFRKVIKKAENGGKACGPGSRKTPCNTDACPDDRPKFSDVVKALQEDSDSVQDKVNVGSLVERLNKLRDGIEKIRKLLLEYYTVSGAMANATQILEKTFLHGPERNREMFYQGEEQLVDRFLRALLYDRKFTVGTIGSSVTAGHDNCHYDCYQEQLNRLMQPAFSDAGFEFECLNAGMTGGCGDSFKDQPMCMKHTLGEDVDLVHYSWTYFEHRDVEKYQERFIRWAYKFPKSPLPLILNTGNCNNLLGENRSMWYRKLMYLKYGPLGMNYLCMQGGLWEGGHYEKGKPGMEPGKVGDKLHDTTRYGENETAQRKRSLGVVYRNWHPGPLQFQLVADALGWQYSNAILKAIDLILKEEDPKSKWDPYPDKVELEEPSHCDPAICDTKNPPSCHNAETPTYGAPSVEYLDPSSSDYPYDKETYNWARHDDRVTMLIPRDERSRPECQHLDHCGGWWRNGGNDSGWIAFKFNNLETGRIIFCCQGKQGGKEAVEQGELIVELNNNRVEIEPVMDKCVLVQEKFSDPAEASQTHILGIFQPKSAKKICTIDHVIGV